MDFMDASFTFISRIDEIEMNIKDKRWQSALALALTIPDICGGIAYPDLVKRYRDGRIKYDYKKRTSRDVGAQYMRWFDEYASSYFMNDDKPYICGQRCWQLRCEYLHQNKGFQNEEEEVQFHLGVNCGTSVCHFDSNEHEIRIDIEQFCLRMCKAGRAYYEKYHNTYDFSLYFTPVLEVVEEKTWLDKLFKR